MTDRELMQQALDVIELPITCGEIKREKAIADLRERLAQSEQEPVAWMYHGIRHDDTPHERPSLIWKPEYMDAMSAEKGVKATPLYAAPPPRQWKGLTDEVIEHIAKPYYKLYGFDVPAFARAVEAKLKEKNG